MSRIIGAISAWEFGRSWDSMAMGLSGVCLVHCAMTSMLLGMLASVGGLFAAPEVHEAGLALALIFALIAFVRGLQQHGLALPAMVGGVGLMAMGLALMAPHGGAETLLTMVGVIILGFAHWLNRRASA